MHFCLTGQYTPRAVKNLLENPTQNRAEAAKKLVEAAGGKLVSFYGMPVEGPGVLTIFDVRAQLGGRDNWPRRRSRHPAKRQADASADTGGGGGGSAEGKQA
jgi:hypothetical protein